MRGKLKRERDLQGERAQTILLEDSKWRVYQVMDAIPPLKDPKQ